MREVVNGICPQGISSEGLPQEDSTRPKRHEDPTKLCVCTCSHEKGVGDHIIEGGPVGHSVGCVTGREEQGVSCRRAGSASPTLLAEAWFQNGLIAGDTDTLFILVCPAHAWLPRSQTAPL